MLEELVHSKFVGVDYHDNEWEGEGRMNLDVITIE